MHVNQYWTLISISSRVHVRAVVEGCCALCTCTWGTRVFARVFSSMFEGIDEQKSLRPDRLEEWSLGFQWTFRIGKWRHSLEGPFKCGSVCACVCVLSEWDVDWGGSTQALCPSYSDTQVYKRQCKSAREIVRVCEWVMNSCYTFASIALFGNLWPLHSLPPPPQPHFSVFWDLYCAAPDRRETCEHSSEAKAFHDYVSDQTRCIPCGIGYLYVHMFVWDTHVNTTSHMSVIRWSDFSRSVPRRTVNL